MGETKALIGRKAICGYLKCGHGAFYKLVEAGAPIHKRNGLWTAHCLELDGWFASDASIYYYSNFENDAWGGTPTHPRNSPQPDQ